MSSQKMTTTPEAASTMHSKYDRNPRDAILWPERNGFTAPDGTGT